MGDHGNSVPGKPEINGLSGDKSQDLYREVVMLRARCANLRHWSRWILEDPKTNGVLPEATVLELVSTTPEVSESEAQEVVSLLARNGSVTPDHPLARWKRSG